MKSETAKKFSLFIISLAFVVFVYGTVKALQIADKTQIGTPDGIYTSYVTTSEEIKHKAFQVTQTCKSDLCRVQNVLDFVSNIPYESKTFQQYSAEKTLEQNYGDCDDKSNLLISMLHALGIKAYLVLVPHHIFVIVSLEDERLEDTKGLWINGKKYYILESTAKNSDIGFPLHYAINDIQAILEPFSNSKIKIMNLEYKL